MQEVYITLTVDQLNLILHAVAQRPWAEANPIIQLLQQQTTEQLEPEPVVEEA